MEPGRKTLWDNSTVWGADSGPRFQWPPPPPPLKTPKVSRRAILMTHKVKVHQIAVHHYMDCNVGSGHSLETALLRCGVFPRCIVAKQIQLRVFTLLHSGVYCLEYKPPHHTA